MIFKGFRKQSTSTYALSFMMIASTDHITGATALSPTVTISKNDGAFSSPSGAVSELGSGWYKIAGNTTDSNTLGELKIHATSAGADPSDCYYVIVPYDPFDANLGLTNLDAAVSTRSTYAGGAVASVTAAVTVGTNNDKTGYTVSTNSDKTGYSLSVTPPTAQQVADTTLDTVTEGTWTLRKILRILMAAFGGKSSGGGTTTDIYRDVMDTKPRITATVDTNGNRSAVTLDGD